MSTSSEASLTDLLASSDSAISLAESLSSSSSSLSECSDGSSSLSRCKNRDHKFTVCVEGNIGAGKSTFLDVFRRNSNDIAVYPEPVHKWKDINGINALDMMYKDATRWGLAFQSYVQLTMLQIHNQQQTETVKLMERSLFSARYCFVENLYRNGTLTDFDYQILDEWYDWIMEKQKVQVDLIVYLRASPQTCLDRIRQRNRSEEVSVPLDYLESLHNLHEQWLVEQKFPHPGAPVLIMDANKPLKDFTIEIEDRREQILTTC